MDGKHTGMLEVSGLSVWLYSSSGTLGSCCINAMEFVRTLHMRLDNWGAIVSPMCVVDALQYVGHNLFRDRYKLARHF